MWYGCASPPGVIDVTGLAPAHARGFALACRDGPSVVKAVVPKLLLGSAEACIHEPRDVTAARVKAYAAPAKQLRHVAACDDTDARKDEKLTKVTTGDSVSFNEWLRLATT